MRTQTPLGKFFRLKDGKIVKSASAKSVSEKIRQRKSKRVKVKRKGDI